MKNWSKKIWQKIIRWIAKNELQHLNNLQEQYILRTKQHHEVSGQRNMWAYRWATLFDSIQFNSKIDMPMLMKITSFIDKEYKHLPVPAKVQINNKITKVIWFWEPGISQVVRAETMRVIWNNLGIKIPYSIE